MLRSRYLQTGCSPDRGTQGFLSSTDMQVTGPSQNKTAWSGELPTRFSDKYGGVDTRCIITGQLSIRWPTLRIPLRTRRGDLYQTGFCRYQGKVEGQSNVKMEKIVEFEGLATGRMVSAEEQVLDGAGLRFPPNGF